MAMPNDLTKLHTKQLLRLKRTYHQHLFCWGGREVTQKHLTEPYAYCPFEAPLGFTADELLSELNTREHVLTKKELKQRRQQRARRRKRCRGGE